MEDNTLQIGDTVRVCRPWLHDKSRFVEGVIRDIQNEDVSYHGSPCYKKNYLVTMADNTSGWMYVHGSGIRDMYISPVPQNSTIYSKILNNISELNSQMVNENTSAISRLIEYGCKESNVSKDEEDFWLDYTESCNKKVLNIQKSIYKLLDIGAKLTAGDISADLFESDGTFQIEL